MFKGEKRVPKEEKKIKKNQRRKYHSRWWISLLWKATWIQLNHPDDQQRCADDQCDPHLDDAKSSGRDCSHPSRL